MLRHVLPIAAPAGVALVAAGVAVVAIAPPLGHALGLAFAAIGALAIAVLAPAGAPSLVAQATGSGSAATLAEVRDALALHGAPIVVPKRGATTLDATLFLPSTDAGRLPVFDDVTRLYAGGPGVRHGVSVTPPGLALVRAAEVDGPPRTTPPSMAEASELLVTMGSEQRLWDRLQVAQGEPLLVTRRPSQAAACSRERPELCATLVCAACSAVAIVLACAEQRPLVARDATWDDDALTLRLEAAS